MSPLGDIPFSYLGNILFLADPVYSYVHATMHVLGLLKGHLDRSLLRSDTRVLSACEEQVCPGYSVLLLYGR
jgi:hypothetical protein